MAKPVLVIEVGQSVELADMKNIMTLAQNQFNPEYHVLVVKGEREYGGCKVYAVNDCKGLKDADIKELIEKFHKQQNK